MKLFRLTYNEFVKQFKKPSIKIIYSLILISALVLPMVLGNLSNKDKYEFDAVNGDSLKSNIMYLEDEIKALENEKGQKEKIKKKYFEIQKEYNEILLDNKIGYDDWRKIEADNYQNALYRLASIQFVLDGYRQDIVLQELTAQDPDEVIKYYKLNKTKKKEIEANFIKEKDEILEVIKNEDYNKHTLLQIQRAEGYIVLNEKKIEEYEKFKAKLEKKKTITKADEAKLKKLEEDKNLAIESITNFNQNLEILKFRANNNIDYSNNNWKNNAIVELEKTLSDYRMKMLDENQYNLDYSKSLSSSYEDYVAGYKKANQIRESRMKELRYSLENEIPHLGAVKDARSIIDSTYEIYVVLAVVVVIIIGGSIVSNEYSTGSIRLLLIRPVSRWKVLLSKLILVLIVGFSIVILGTTILSVTSGAVFGFESLEVPVLQTVNGQILEINYFEYMIPQLLTSCASLIFVTSVVFMISTLARNTALAVAVGMLLYIGVGPLTQLLISLKQIWLIDTLLPYINSSFFKLMPDTVQMLSESGLTLNYTQGANELLIVSAVLLVISFIIFSKRDVKN